MNNHEDIKRAWEFVTGFDVPQLTVDKRDDWATLIGSMSAQDFDQAVDRCFERPMGVRHLRPSISTFHGYSKPEKPQAIGGIMPGSKESTPKRHQRGCEECDWSGWFEVDTGEPGVPSTVRPCHFCCADQYEFWLNGGMKGTRIRAQSERDAVEPKSLPSIIEAKKALEGFRLRSRNIK